SEVVDDATVHADLTAVDVRASDPPGQTVDGDLVLQSFLGEGERSGAESGRSGRGIFLGPGQVRREVRAAGDVDLTADLTTRIRRGVDVDVVVASEQLGDLAGREILPGAVRGSPVSQE